MFAVFVMICICFFANTEIAYAEEYVDYVIITNPLESEELDNVVQVIESEIVYDSSENGIMPLSNYREIDYDKTMTYAGVLADGSLRYLFSVNLSGIFYYYDDGKVHLYSLRASSHVYEENSWIDALTPIINNTDGSYSEGLFCFNFAHDVLGIYACRAVVSFTRNSTAVASNLEIITHVW